MRPIRPESVRPESVRPESREAEAEGRAMAPDAARHRQGGRLRTVQRAAVGGLFALWLAPLGAQAESQSSNSSSNCSDGRCTRVETLRVEDEAGVRAWVRRETSQEPQARSWRPEWRPGPVFPWPMTPPPRRGRDDDDD